MVCQNDALVRRVCELYEQISKLESLEPCKDVNTLFTTLVVTCMPSDYPIDVTKLCQNVQAIRSKLIRLCGEAEGLLESHFSSLLASRFENPIPHLPIFPYYSNYIKLSKLEFDLLARHCPGGRAPANVAFIGSGPLPLTSIVLATNHLTESRFHNYDVDPSANSKALGLVSPDPDLSPRMFFHTANILDVSSHELKDYEVVFLAALVGMDKEEKVRVIDHLANHMAPGALLMLRSAHGARAFLYPVVDACDLRGFDVLSVYHPTDEVINSVVVARKCDPIHSLGDHDHDHHQQQQQDQVSTMILPKKCSKIEAFMMNPLNHRSMIDELAIEEQLS